MPSATPTRKTTSHSRPFAEWREARVTPWTVGACCAAGALLEFGHEVAEGGVGLGGGEVLGEVGEGGEGFPALSDGAGSRRWLIGPAVPGQDGSYLRGQVGGVVEE